MTSKSYFEKIRQLIRNDDLDAAIKLLGQLLKNAPKLDEAILQSARWNDLKKQVRMGQIDYESAQINKNQIRFAVLEMLKDIEEQTTEPAIKEETEAYLHSIQIYGKNIISGSTIQAGGSVTIGDQTITESKTSRNLRLFLFVFVPLLAIAFGVLYFQYQKMQRPLQLDVALDNQTPNPHLPFERGMVILQYDGKRDTQYTTSETLFEAIPTNNLNKTVRLQFLAEGFQTVDTMILLDQESLNLPIRRDDTYSQLFGTVVDDDGAPIEGAKVWVEDMQLSTTTGPQGEFSIKIPFAKQRTSQRLKVQKAGYGSYNRDEPVIQDRSARIQLIKN